MANLTVTLDAGLIRRARGKALERGTSLNAVVREYLETFAGPSPAEEGVALFLELAEASGYGAGPEGITWSREELHERADLR